jgi:hypothetical protein
VCRQGIRVNTLTNARRRATRLALDIRRDVPRGQLGLPCGCGAACSWAQAPRAKTRVEPFVGAGVHGAQQLARSGASAGLRLERTWDVASARFFYRSIAPRIAADFGRKPGRTQTPAALVTPSDRSVRGLSRCIRVGHTFDTPWSHLRNASSGNFASRPFPTPACARQCLPGASSS